MSSNKLSILIMRDNEKVRRMRISSGWISAVIWLFVILVCLAALNGTAAWWLYQKYERFQELDQAKDRVIADLRVQLERYQNMEKIVGAAPPERRDAGDSPPRDAASGVSAGEERGNESPPSAREREKAASPARISNINVRPRSGRQIRLSFDLSNADAGTVLAGHILVAVQTKADNFIDVFPPKDELAFQIARFKRVATSFNLPDGVAMNDVKAVRVEVRLSNGFASLPEVFTFPTPEGPPGSSARVAEDSLSEPAS